MPHRVEPVAVACEGVGYGRAQDGVQVGQRDLGQGLQHREVEHPEAGVGEEAVAEVHEWLRLEGRAPEHDEVEWDDQKQDMLKVVSEDLT